MILKLFITTTIFFTTLSILFYYLYNKIERRFKDYVKHRYDNQLEWIGFYKKRLKFFRSVGLQMPQDEALMKHLENNLMNDYANIFHVLNEKTLEEQLKIK
jgi:hypothetical protein